MPPPPPPEEVFLKKCVQDVGRHILLQTEIKKLVTMIEEELTTKYDLNKLFVNYSDKEEPRELQVHRGGEMPSTWG